MAWERHGKRDYYYYKVRVGRNSCRIYMGYGERAQQAAAEVASRKALREQWKAEQCNHAAAVVPVVELCNLTDQLTTATLLAHGYYRHARSWRKRRVSR